MSLINKYNNEYKIYIKITAFYLIAESARSKKMLDGNDAKRMKNEIIILNADKVLNR
jgi:hypothetical protein